MKYKVGNIVLLYDSRIVQITEVKPKSESYIVFVCDDESSDMFEIKESSIFQKVVSA